MCNAEIRNRLLMTAMRPGVVPVRPDSPGARRLMALSDAYMTALYPPQSNHLESIEALLLPNVCFMGINDGGELVACGAFKLMEDDLAYGEIKRMFVLPEQRGKGYARQMMVALETELRARGVIIARLETGILQPEALGLYHALGYRDRGPYGSYIADPLSVFMEKQLSARDP
jgi:putative acetyltransferase